MFTVAPLRTNYVSTHPRIVVHSVSTQPLLELLTLVQQEFDPAENLSRSQSCCALDVAVWFACCKERRSRNEKKMSGIKKTPLKKQRKTFFFT